VILIFYACAREVTAFKRRVESRGAIGVDGVRGFRARLGATQLAAVATGLGIRRASDAARLAIEAFPAADLVIATGVAGALNGDLESGEVVLADRLILDGKGPEAVSQSLSVAPADLERFKAALKRARLKFTIGTVLTTTEILADGAAKRAASARTGAIAVDMESAAVAAEANRRGLRFTCIRAVLDAVDETIVGAELAGPDGEVRALAAASFMLRNPAAVLGLSRMMRMLGRAKLSIADALEAVIRSSP
jgi:adenosylhomocysteine nucleosidase